MYILFYLSGSPEEVLLDFCRLNMVSTVVCDFSPTRIAKHWKTKLVTALEQKEDQEEGNMGQEEIPVKVIEVHITTNRCMYAWPCFLNL